jgi:hypothetical protein
VQTINPEFSEALVVVIRNIDHLPRARRLSRTGEADQIALRVREVRDHEVYPRAASMSGMRCAPARMWFRRSTKQALGCSMCT